MMRLSLLCLGLSIFSQLESGATTYSADTIPLIHSGKTIEEGVLLRNEDKNDLAIQKFLSVPESDTNFVMMRSELIVSYLETEAWDKAIALGEAGLKENSNYKARFYVALGNAYSGKDMVDKAIEVYEKGLKSYPYDYLLHYNLGVALVKKKELDKAISQLQRSIILNPFYANSHLYLGDIMVMQGKKSRAMMCMATYLALMPNNNQALVLLNNLLKNSVSYENSHPAEEKVPAFYELDLLIKSNAALDKKFKSTVAFKAPVAQQLELMVEAMPATTGNADDFWMQVYVPLFKKTFEAGLKEAFVYHTLTSVDDKGVKRWLKSNQKELDNYFTLAREHLKSLRIQHTATLQEQKGQYSFWYYDNHRLNAIGNQIDDETFIGPWVFFHDNGEKIAEGSYTKDGKKTGKWRYYHANGVLQKLEEFNSQDQIIGVQTNYSLTGKVLNEIPYKEGLIEGLVKIYYPCGQLKEALPYKADKREGSGTGYYPGGQVNSQYTYQADEPVNTFTYFYKNGNKKEVYTYKEGKLNGSYQYYHKNGKVAQQGQYLNGDYSGEWLGFYDDGSKRTKGSYNNGQRTGTWYAYYPATGTLQSEELYNEKGEMQGTAKYFTEEGQLHYEYDYKGGLLVGYRYFNKDKKVISQASDSKGNFRMKAHYPDGKLRHEGDFKKGKGNGLFTYYYPHGIKSSEIQFKDDTYEGSYTTFYETGQKNVVCSYVQGAMHGYYQQFYRNGQLQTEGWAQQDNMEQTWVTYFPDGRLSHKQYYLFGEGHGIYEEADGQGRPYVKNTYYHGTLTNSVQYDTLGAIMHTEGLDMGNGKNSYMFASKKPRYTAPMQCGEYAGDVKSFYKNGKIYSNTPVKNGEYNGRFQAYYPNQKLRTEGNYLDHEQSGIWTWYFESGKVDSKIPLKEGKTHGERIDYYENGQIRTTGTYKEGDKIGSSLYYASDGSLQIEKVYDAHGVLRYRYLDKNNQLVPFIELANYAGTVKAYYANGKVSVEQNYKNSVFDGRQVVYYPSGQVQEVRMIKDGIEEGVREEYFPDGKLQKSSPYKNDELHGQEVEYYANGKVKRKTNYLYGDKEGWEVTYDQNGKLLLKEYIRDGFAY